MPENQRPVVLLDAYLTSLCQVNVASPTSSRPFQPLMVPTYSVTRTNPNAAPCICSSGVLLGCELRSLSSEKLPPVMAWQLILPRIETCEFLKHTLVGFWLHHCSFSSNSTSRCINTSNVHLPVHWNIDTVVSVSSPAVATFYNFPTFSGILRYVSGCNISTSRVYI